MRENEIVLFRYRKGLRIGYHLETAQSKARVAIDKDRSFTVPSENLIYGTGRIAEDRGDFLSFCREMEALAAEIDLEELWELVRDESEALDFRALAELYWTGDLAPERYAALLWHLNGEGCLYFTTMGELYTPADDHQVAAHKERLLRHAQQASEERSFLAWLSGETDDLRREEMSHRQKSWLDRLVDYVVAGEEYHQSAWAKSFLAPLQKGGDPRRFAFDLLVGREILAPDENLDLRRLQVPIEFTEEAAAAAEAYDGQTARSALQRRDLRNLEVFSIDSETTTDVDDALSVRVTDSGYELGVHITDLTTAVGDGTPLDQVARQRVVSFYFPERRIPMLPPSLSSGSCSLLEGEERPVLTLLARFDREFGFTGAELTPGWIINRHQLSYDQVDDILHGANHPLAEKLETLDKLAEVCRRRRVDAGAVEIDRPEVEIHIDEAGEIQVDCKSRETPANRLVSEIMILYNVEVARYCTANSIPFIFRAQTMGDQVPAVDPGSGAYGRYQFFKKVAPSYFSMRCEPHSLLGVELYTQASSPLRRYIDLIAQRQLIHLLRTGKAAYSEERITLLLHEIEERLRELGRLESLRKRYWLLKYLSKRRRESFEAWVLEVRERDCMVELEGYGLRGPAEVGGTVKPGDKVAVEVTHVDYWDHHVRFRGRRC